MKLVVSRDAVKALYKMPAPVARNIRARLAAIAADPFAPHLSVTALKGEQDRFRLRVGDWRALYRVDRAADTVFLEDVLKREDAYR